MTFEEAKEFHRRNHGKVSAKNIHATSDGCFYMDTDLIKLAAHAKDNSLEIFILKGQEIKIESTPQIDSDEKEQPAKKK